MGYNLIYACAIGKKEDKSDCTKKDCENCRHWVPVFDSPTHRKELAKQTSSTELKFEVLK